MEIRVGAELAQEDVVALYDSVGWTIYARNPEGLMQAIAASDYVVTAWDGERLIGLARGLSDDLAIFYLKDILVHPDYQRRGVGRLLTENCLERYAHVRTKVLLTDDEPRQKQFYESLGFVNTKDIEAWTLNAYVQLKGLTDQSPDD